MAASRRGQPPLSVHLPGGGGPGLGSGGSPAFLPDLPPISALFLIDFDVKAGYTIIWKQAVPGLELEGVVEYKSLPSGLHTVPDDLIYFVHDEGYAGLSAFVNTKTDEEESRHARMIAVGVLVPLSYGRLGRAWRHAEGLKSMAAELALDRKQTTILEEYWERSRARDASSLQAINKDSPLTSPVMSFNASRASPRKGHARNRSASDAGALIPPGHRLSPFHPAWSLTTLLDTFGPLIFPIHRAALLRKRILISTHAPVHETCNFVYDISILANIPLSVFDLLDPSAPSQRLRPLFTIGVHDIPFLLEDNAASKRRASGTLEESNLGGTSGSGWIACTTDSILAMKDDLWDLLITMPPPHSSNAQERIWPTVESPKGHPVKATQRDLRRFRSLRAGLKRVAATNAVSEEGSPSSEAPPTAPRPRQSTSSGVAGFYSEEDSMLADAAEKVVEPTTWAALAYSGFMWWASAGEQERSDEAEESAHDATLLVDLAPPVPQQSLRASGLMVDSITSLNARRATTYDGLVPTDEEEDRARTELATIAYFHRLTTQILSVLADIVESSDEDDMLDVDPEGEGDVLLQQQQQQPGEEGEDDDGRGYVRVDSECLSNLGLDVWSQADAEFVRQVVARYFTRRAYVEGKGVEVCGLKVC